MNTYNGSCHCGSVSFSFTGPAIDEGLKCNCSICLRKGAAMTAFTIAQDDMKIAAQEGALSVYQFGSKVAKHYFCNRCGIYTFNETLRKPGHFRANLACLEGINPLELPTQVFDGASL
ncbi:MAG: GFA family protein [Desulfuromonadales bacterium]|nr:GFA family protein [Desulfuromonadales bacterium]